MKTINEKLQLLKNKLDANEPVKIMIIGLGSVGCYLLDYLVSLADPQLELIVVGRNKDKMQMDVNIIRTAATIRHQLQSKITVYGNCDLNDVESIANCLKIYSPDFIVNSSRVYSGLKYGSISWSNFRAYGIWAPLSITYARNIMLAYDQANSHAISINTSYSDAVIPWLKSAGLPYFDFGSGNLNHLIPRMKFYVAEKFGMEGHIGGYPYIIDGSEASPCAYVDTSVFGMSDMESANRNSIYCDGIADVTDGSLVYTAELQEKVKRTFGVEIPKVVRFEEIPQVANLLIEKIIKVALDKK